MRVSLVGKNTHVASIHNIAKRRGLGGMASRPAPSHRACALPYDDEDIDAKLEDFMKRQAEIESGLAKKAKAEDNQVMGSQEVAEEDARRFCRDIVNVLKLLKNSRDMTVNEVRLTLAIEDPRARDRRKMDMEDASGVSRDEIAAALMDVAEGKIPTDRIALRELHRELMSWPGLDPSEPGTTGR
jgi:hypothetical protein